MFVLFFIFFIFYFSCRIYIAIFISVKLYFKTTEIINAIEKLNENWKPMQILDYLIEERNKNNIANQLTIDIIKNIKRKLSNKKHVIYETELPKEKYDYYLQLFKHFTEINI